MNKSTITREQKREEKINKSTLDYFITNLNPTSLETWEGGGSDHKPIVSDMNVPNITTRKIENFTINRSIIPSVNTINKILDNKQWPTIRISNEEATRILIKKHTVRPTIKIQSQANKIFTSGKDWSQVEIGIKELRSQSFKEYTKSLNTWRKEDAAKFYQILNSLLKYKTKKLFVKGMRDKDGICYGKNKDKMVKQYFNNIYKGREKHKLKINNNIFDFTVEIDRALEALATHKATGPDLISAECLKVKDKRNEMKSRLFAHFTDHLHNWRVPDYYMKARLVLFSKEDNENPEIKLNKTDKHTTIDYKSIRILYRTQFWKSSTTTLLWPCTERFQ